MQPHKRHACEGHPLLRHSEAAGRGIPPSGAEQYVTVDAETQILRHSEAAGRGIPHSGAAQYVVVTSSNHPGDCVVAKSAWLRFRITAKASPAPLLLLFGRDPLRWVRVRDEGCRLRLPLNDSR